jgi:cellulose synthase/poly-beta-1,6-N-acetylglucosamine synthase-like glycosyltransferase
MSVVDFLLIALVLLSGLALIWPFVIYPLILRFMPLRPVTPDAVELPPRVSLLFCAYNEEASLPAKIANLRALKARHPRLEVLAYDDGSTDGTAALLEGAIDLITPVRGPGRKGKAHGMKLLAARAKGEILLFTDANVILAEDAIERMRAYYAEPAIGGVLGSLRYAGTDKSATASVGGLYWRLEEHLKDLESMTGSVMGADGSIFSVRRQLYPDFPDDVLDDLTVSMSVIFAGWRLIKADDVIAYEMLVAERADEYRRKVRIAARAWHTHRHLRPQLKRMRGLDRFKYGSRKIVRWFGALWMMIGGGAALALAWRCSPVAAMGLFLLALLLLLAGLQMRRGPLAALVDMLLAYVATLRGVVMAMRGRTFTTWAPAKSRD